MGCVEKVYDLKGYVEKGNDQKQYDQEGYCAKSLENDPPTISSTQSKQGSQSHVTPHSKTA